MTCVKCDSVFKRIKTVGDVEKYLKGDRLDIKEANLSVNYHPPTKTNGLEVPERYVVSCDDCGATRAYEK